jgi:hypothetical protein
MGWHPWSRWALGWYQVWGSSAQRSLAQQSPVITDKPKILTRGIKSLPAGYKANPFTLNIEYITVQINGYPITIRPVKRYHNPPIGYVVATKSQFALYEGFATEATKEDDRLLPPTSSG